jgi:hypothetical protein
MKYDIKSIVADVQSFWATRRTLFLRYWDYYYGSNQRYYMRRFDGEDASEYAIRVDSAVVENHCSKTCDVIVGYLYGQPTSESRVNAKVLGKEDKVVEPAMELLLDNIWRFNNMDAFRIRLALMASVTGVSVVHKEFVDKRTGLPFPSTTSKADKKKYGTIRYDLFDSVDTMPIPLINGDKLYKGLLGGVVRIYGVQDARPAPNPLLRLFTNDTSEQIVEVYTDESFTTARIRGSWNLEADSVNSSPNPYKSIHIPFTVFSNYGDPTELEGKSDLDQMIPLQNALNELNNDDLNTISYHSAPLLKLTKGAKMPPNFVRKANSAIELDGEQDADYLTWDNVLDASDKKEESIRKQMTVVSGVSQLSRGNAGDVGQVRSGPGLKTLFQADINEIGLKVPYFRMAEEKLIESTLAMWEAETGDSFGEYEACVEFPEDFVGLDKLLNAQVDKLEMDANIVSIREKVAERHPEIESDEELDAIVQEIMAEKKKLAVATKPPQPVKPNSPEGQSVKQSGPA